MFAPMFNIVRLVLKQLKVFKYVLVEIRLELVFKGTFE